jgi:hypothetical protein
LHDHGGAGIEKSAQPQISAVLPIRKRLELRIGAHPAIPSEIGKELAGQKSFIADIDSALTIFAPIVDFRVEAIAAFYSGAEFVVFFEPAVIEIQSSDMGLVVAAGIRSKRVNSNR